MYSLTLLSIMRNSSTYIDRYFAQVDALFSAIPGDNQLIVVEGDSTDDTRAKFIDYAQRRKYSIVFGTLNNGGRKWGSYDNPIRWKMLEAAWNACLKLAIKPTDYAICVESDLIWDSSVPLQLIGELKENEVRFPMLMHYDLFYDTNAFRFHDASLTMQRTHPYFPIEHEKEVSMKTGGGMLVMHGTALQKAKWLNKCVLHYPQEISVICNTELSIQHP